MTDTVGVHIADKRIGLLPGKMIIPAAWYAVSYSPAAGIQITAGEPFTGAYTGNQGRGKEREEKEQKRKKSRKAARTKRRAHRQAYRNYRGKGEGRQGAVSRPDGRPERQKAEEPCCHKAARQQGNRASMVPQRTETARPQRKIEK